MTTYTLANVGDPANTNPDWTYDGSNNLNASPGVGLTIGFVTPTPIANSVDVTGGYYVSGTNLTGIFAPIITPNFTTSISLGGVNILTGRAKSIHNNLLPTAYTNGTSSFLMAGQGATCTITPATSGLVVFLTTGFLESTTSGLAKVNFGYGTGTAPTQGAAQTGTLLIPSNAGNPQTISIGVVTPFTIVGAALLTVGTAYWMDWSIADAGGGVADLSNLSLFAVEV